MHSKPKLKKHGYRKETCGSDHIKIDRSLARQVHEAFERLKLRRPGEYGGYGYTNPMAEVERIGE